MDRRSRQFSASTMLATIVILFAASMASAQGPAPEAFPDQQTGKVYTRKTLFRLPIKIDEKTRAATKDVVLYVKQLPGPWQKQDTAPPTQSMFTYQAPSDGEFWFSVGTIDRSGRSTPADINQEQPALMVVVDTKPPVIDVQPLPLPGGELVFRCLLRDTTPDYTSIKLSYKAQDGGWRPLDAIPNQPGLFRVPSPDVIHRALRCTASDRLGNSSTQDIEPRGLTLTGGTGPIPGSPLGPAPVTPSVPIATGMPPAHLSKPAPPTMPPPAVIETPAVALSPSVPESPPRPPVQTPAPAPAPLPPAISNPAFIENVVQKPAFPPAAPLVFNNQRQLLTTTRAQLEYRIDPVGPSGIGKVDVWLTADQGMTWQKLCTDYDRQTPVELTLPGEGQFGLRLAVTNGNGFGGTPPKTGDTPTCIIEVDTVPPVAQLRTVEPTSNPGVLEIRWTASDRNLGTEPVNLYYAARREGPWQVIARNVRNDGMYRWQFPRDVGGQFLVRLEVTDQAGHATRSDTPQPVTLDMIEPQAQVLGVTGLSSRPLTPTGP